MADELIDASLAGDPVLAASGFAAGYGLQRMLRFLP